MRPVESKFAVVGAGFFGLSSALYLAKKGFSVVVFERNAESMVEASLYNQARVHGGYHYPRALRTAARCRANYSRFLENFGSAIEGNFVSSYAIALDSKVSSVKFERFAEMIGAPLYEMPSTFWKEFDARFVEKGWIVEEAAFDANKLKNLLLDQLQDIGVKISYSTDVESLVMNQDTEDLERSVLLRTKSGEEDHFYGALVATYGQSPSIVPSKDFHSHLIYEVCELVRVNPPAILDAMAVTIMDGPYWSLTPWPAFHSHALSHVRFTPHNRFSNPQEALDYLQSGNLTSRAHMMMRDASRYLPCIADSQVVASEYVIKTIAQRRDYDDARPVIYVRDQRVLSVLGSKIDNIYEVEPLIDQFLEELAHGS